MRAGAQSESDATRSHFSLRSRSHTRAKLAGLFAFLLPIDPKLPILDWSPINSPTIFVHYASIYQLYRKG